MQLAHGPKLAGQSYRSEKELALQGGGYPRALRYKDAVDLTKVKSAEGAPVSLQAGMDLEYWLKACDACDYPTPGGNVAESQHFHLKLLPPETDAKKQQQEREQADENRNSTITNRTTS